MAFEGVKYQVVVYDEVTIALTDKLFVLRNSSKTGVS